MRYSISYDLKEFSIASKCNIIYNIRGTVLHSPIIRADFQRQSQPSLFNLAVKMEYLNFLQL